MPLRDYRRMFAYRQVPTAMLLTFLARVPMTAMGLTLTLHIVSALGMGYGAAGLVGMMTTVGTAAAAPFIGRMLDRHGLRPVIAACTTASAAYWISAPHLTYPLLLILAFPAGMLAVPASPVMRQILAAIVPARLQRTAYSLDSILIELSFMLGPATGILLTTQLSSTIALTAIGACFGAAGTALYLVNPPIRTADTAHLRKGERPPLRDWLTPRLARALLLAGGALFVLVGTELAALAILREHDQVSWTSLVIVVMCLASLAGGLTHGAVHRSLSQPTLMILLAALVVPVGLAGGAWWLLALALIPTNLMCAPTLAAGAEAISHLAPAKVRGEAMGMLDSATRLGLAIGSPAVGFVMDHSSAAWGFAAAGLGGLFIAAVAVTIGRLTPSTRDRAGELAGSAA
ncbi:MFS transporter [Haloechinothrix sp. YIM 98757]|uniref:MFS transporter n=1 Tax=Haloechinothrix aidingensis TaxID=2752311 RepID=A0A838ADR8_9PSEU|nr:MFS transporter [Haloechinothrix aidingensis]MBA0127432.1 MFS transporter [Haloechinothrix aidingensis]